MRADQTAELVLSGGSVLTMDSDRSYFEQGTVAVKDGMIARVGPAAELAETSAERRIDTSGKAVLPGFVSCHGHAGLALLRGRAEDYPLEAWLRRTVWPVMGQARPEDTHAGVLLACLEMLLSGITTFADMWRDLPASTEAVAKSGLRALLAFNMRDHDDPGELDREWRQGFDALAGTPRPRIRLGLAPHSLYACSRDLLIRVSEALENHGCHVQIHLAETRDEVEICRHRFGLGPVDCLEEFGLLNERLLVAHAVWLDDKECRRLARSGASVSHNVTSNLKLGSGAAPLHAFRAAGVNFGLGTDSAASNNVLDPFREMRLAALTHCATSKEQRTFGAYAALEAATHNGAKALGMADCVGSLEVGKRADLIIIDLDKPHLQPRIKKDRDSLAELLVYSATARDVQMVIVDGEIVMANRVVLTLDAETVVSQARAATRRLLDRAYQN